MENCGEPLAPCSPSWRIYNRFRIDFHTLKRYSQIETNERQGGSRYAEVFHKSAAVPHNPCPDFAGSFCQVLLSVFQDGSEYHRRSFLFGVLMLFIGEWQGFIGFSLLAWAISPYGLPGAASWLTERMDDINSMLKAI